MIELRPMQLEDIPQIVAIEKTHTPDPWTERIFGDCLFVGYHCWVLVEGSDVVAYAVASVNAPESHLLNIAVKEGYRRQGLAQRLIAKIRGIVCVHQAKELHLEVRVSNYGAIDLYQKLGFVRVGYRKEYYKTEQGREDAFIFLLEL